MRPFLPGAVACATAAANPSTTAAISAECVAVRPVTGAGAYDQPEPKLTFASNWRAEGRNVGNVFVGGYFGWTA